MRNFIRRRGALVALSLAIGLVTVAVGRADPEEDKAIAAAQKEVVGLTGKLDDKEVADQAKKIAKANDIEYVMRSAFKPRSKGGVGVGAAKPPKMGDVEIKDSVELAIIDMAVSRKPNPGPMILDKNNNDFVKVATITRAVAEINSFYPPPKKKGAIPGNYKIYNDDMKKAAKELEEAVKAKDQGKVTAAAVKLNKSCIDCHMMFRDVP
jgi:hypothetical protein